MNRWELLLLAVVLWTTIGLAGTVLALVRRERRKALRGALWMAGVWVVYLVTELTVATMQKQRVYAPGQRKCFDELCFSVEGVEEVPSFFGRNVADDGTRLLRVTLLIENKSRTHARRDGSIIAYLTDRAGRPWVELSGLDSVPPTSSVHAGRSVESRPIFRVPAQTDLLGLVLTHGHSQPGRLVIGDSDSFGHRPDVFALR